MMLACDLSIGYHSASAATPQRMAPSVRDQSLLASREGAKTRREEDADSSFSMPRKEDPLCTASRLRGFA
jgi:hypothetical protein